MPRVLVLAVVALAGLLAPVAPGIAGDIPSPRAADVVSRGSRTLAHALEIALQPATTAAPRDIAIVVDVTENTRRKRPELETALDALQIQAGGWQIAPLGSRLGDRVEGPGYLARQVRQAFGKETPAVSTVKALRSTIRTAPRNAVIVYLADWRFEDDTGLRELVNDLRRNGRTLSVIGSEAGFGRAWNDGVKDGLRRLGAAEKDRYYEGIGRSPFGAADHKAPWHGGDTAYPALPYRFAHRWWQSEFTPFALESLAADERKNEAQARMKERLEKGEDPFEDLEKRNPGFIAVESVRSAFRTVPLPSSFGPYGLMRACGESGGRYVLWSWNPSGRASVKYDFGRCNLFGPDLRARADIKNDVPKLKLARAMVKAWHALLDVDGELVAHTAPFKKDAKSPLQIELIDPSGSFSFSWRDRQEWKTFVRVAGYMVESLDDADDDLATAMEKTKPEDLPTRRYEADAELLLHIVRVLRFSVNEALLVAKDIPKDAWNDKENYPAVVPNTWITPGIDPDKIQTSDVELQDAERGQAVRKAREDMLRRYTGTPFGYQVGLNPVNTFVPTRFRHIDPSEALRSGRSPGESHGDTPETPDGDTTPPRPAGPGGGSGGGGPATGGG